MLTEVGKRAVIIFLVAVILWAIVGPIGPAVVLLYLLCKKAKDLGSNS